MKSLKILLLCFLAGMFACQPTEKVSIQKEGDLLTITGLLPDDVTSIKVQIYSDRNDTISRYLEISPLNPEREKLSTSYQELKWDIFYPVVDLALYEGINAEMVFDIPIDSPYSINGMFHQEISHLDKGRAVIPSSLLQQWENNFYVNNGDAAVSSFYLTETVDVEKTLNLQYRLLTSDWGGEIVIKNAETNQEINRVKISDPLVNPLQGSLSGYDESDLSRERLLKSLTATAQFTIGCQDQSPNGLTRGGLNLFYDLDAKTYRRPTWVWGWGPSIKTLIASAEYPEIQKSISAEALIETATEIGEASLRFQMKDPKSPAYGVIVSRWSENKGTLLENYGFEEYYSVADAQFLVGWGWIPLYELTKDERYLKGAQLMTSATDRLTQQFDLLPMDYMIRASAWKNYALNEQGFATEGINELYRVNPNPLYPKIGDEYMKMLMKKFETPSGIWNRLYRIEQQKAEPTQYHTRGVGWAMEGLIAVYELTGDPSYLNKAVKMGQHLIDNQLDDGSWSYDFKSQNPGEVSEKGTALWSLLFYKLYRFTEDPMHLKTARKALLWCLNNQYDGPDLHAHGGLVGLSRQSGVVYRQWFPLACTYSSGFFGLAVIEELKIQDSES